MNNFFIQFKNIARAIKLDQGEKQALRVNLYTYLEQNPVGAFAAPERGAARPVPSPLFFFSPRFMAPIALLLVVGLGSGTAFAAQGALPGSALYAVKINVNEAVQTALATSPAAKVQVNTQLATARLEEAETLAAAGKLDAAATAALASNLAQHVKTAQAVTHVIESNDPGTAAQLGANFNSTLAAHGAILAQIGDDSANNETMQNSNSLAMEVQQEAEQGDTGGDAGVAVAIAPAPAVATATPESAPVNVARVRTFAAMAPTSSSAGTATSVAPTSSAPVKTKGKIALQSSNPNNAKIAASLGAQASTSLAVMAQDFDALAPSLDASTAAQLAAQITAVQNAYASAMAALAAGDTQGAVRDFTDVIRMSVRLDAYFKAGKKFNLKLLSGLVTAAVSSTGIVKGASTSSKGSHDSGKNDSEKAPAATTSDNETGAAKGSDEGDANVELHL